VVTVKQGLALNAEGEVIGLPSNDVQVALSRSIEATSTSEADFYACAGPPSTKQLPNGVGVYILVMSPAAGYKDRAPKSGLGDNGVVTGCGSRYVQEGIRFRLVELDPTSISGLSSETQDLIHNELFNNLKPVGKTDIPNLSKLRSLLAHLCFGTEHRVADRMDLIGAIPNSLRRNALQSLHDASMLSDCDVCLTLLYWTLDGIAMLDNWSVRRRLPYVGPDGSDIPARFLATRAESEALFLQFAYQLDDLLTSSPNPQQVQLKDYFFALPPAGVVPLMNAGIGKGFSLNYFFNGLTHRDPTHIEDAQLGSILSQSLNYAPVLPMSKEFIWLYYGQENRRTANTAIAGIQEYVVFTSGHMRFFASPRFDLSKWDYSNYVSGLLGPA
jgi:hypothetical protein